MAVWIFLGVRCSVEPPCERLGKILRWSWRARTSRPGQTLSKSSSDDDRLRDSAKAKTDRPKRRDALSEGDGGRDAITDWFGECNGRSYGGGEYPSGHWERAQSPPPTPSGGLSARSAGLGIGGVGVPARHRRRTLRVSEAPLPRALPFGFSARLGPGGRPRVWPPSSPSAASLRRRQTSKGEGRCLWPRRRSRSPLL